MKINWHRLIRADWLGLAGWTLIVLGLLSIVVVLGLIVSWII